MKNRVAVLGAALSLAAICATPALADPSGFISIGVGPASQYVGTDADNETFSGFAIRGAASGVYMFTPVLGAQGDLFYYRGDYGDEIPQGQGIDAALHVFYREPGSFLIGGLVQLGRDRFDYEGSEIFSADRSYVGGEAQVHLDSLTLYAQGGMQQLSIDEELATALSGWFGRAEARYFLTPDLRIEAHVGMDTLEFLNLSLDAVSAGVGAEYKLESLPVSLFASYEYRTSSINVPDAPTINDHRVLVGAKFALGEDSLLDRDRNGASLSPVQTTLPFFFF